MSFKINSNSSALGVERQLGKADRLFQDSVLRLASGQRIIRASDDPAGLSIATTTKLEERIYSRAILNLNDGISFIGVISETLDSLKTIVTRQLELAEQAANGVYSSQQRVPLDREAAELTAEFNRILESSKFNGLSVGEVFGADGEVTLQAGFGSQELLSFNDSSSQSEAGPTGDLTAGITSDLYRPAASIITDSLQGDFDGDGDLDFAFVGQDSNSEILVSTNAGNGSFGSPQTLLGPSFVANYLLATGDFDNDNRDDFVAISQANGSANMISFHGSFGVANFGSYLNTIALRAGAFGSDANEDFVIARSDGSIQVVQGGGNGSTFNVVQTFASGYASPEQGFLELADLNGDTYLDLVVSDLGATTFKVFNGQANGQFAAAVTITVGYAVNDISVGDVDGSGAADVIFGGATGFTAYTGYNGASFAASNFSSGTPIATDAIIVDLNGDDLGDIVAGGGAVYLSNGSGGYALNQTLSPAPDKGTFTGDYNSDGIADILGFDGSSMLTLFTGALGTQETAVALLSNQSNFSIRTQSGARDALDELDDQLSDLGTAQATVGAFESRIQFVISTLRSRSETLQGAAAQILDADIAFESAQLVRSNILRSGAATLLKNINVDAELALTLLDSTGV